MLGCTGMLGHTLLRWLAAKAGVEAIGCAREPHRLARAGLGVVAARDLRDDAALDDLLWSTRPTMAINCIGIVKRSPAAADLAEMTAINAELPHRLWRACAAVGARVVHVSTDCVFSGALGNYHEGDNPDPVDAYGQTKLAGEIGGPGALTLRTSIIGPELASAHGLLEWFLAAPSPVPGYTRARFSGVTTLELAKTMADYVLARPDLEGVYHVAGPAIGKYDLLGVLARAYRPDVEIVAQDAPVIDRTLDGRRFADLTGWRAPDWREMVEAMRAFG